MPSCLAKRNSQAMGSSSIEFLRYVIVVMTIVGLFVCEGNSEANFDQNYEIMPYCGDHVVDQGRQVQLSLTQSCSSVNFASKLSYVSGLFHMRMKVPNKDSAGVVTTFYLSSPGGGNHDELDIEFLGNREGKPVTLQTNVFANDEGNREQRLNLWFDPTQDFHSYKILWNQQQIVFYVDDIPVRVFKNNKREGVNYPNQPMKIEASVWDGSSWATEGGREKIDWRYAPFVAYYQGFDTAGCSTETGESLEGCYSSNYWWNDPQFWTLNAREQREYENVQRTFITYDYCSDRQRHPIVPPEC